MTLNKITEALTILCYRLATYTVNNLIDDPALLALIFCWVFGRQKKSDAPAAAAAEEPTVKKSNTSICHDKSSPSYKQTKNFTEFKTMEECIKCGGRAPMGGK